MKIKISSKHVEIDKAQSRMIVTIAVATVVTIFSLMSARALLGQMMYQGKVIHETNKSIDVIEANYEAANSLASQYKSTFIGDSPTNVLGGRNSDDPSTTPPDGTNARIVLDALPTTYDFPALVTSVAWILSNASISNPSITGADKSTEIDSTPTEFPQPVEINISVSGSSSYENIQKLIKDFERSIRPFDVTTVSLSGSDSSLQVNMNLSTYFQPAKALTIGTKEIK